MDTIEKLFVITYILLIMILIFFLTVPVWSDSKKICKYWKKQDNAMICVREGIFYCLKPECEEDKKYKRLRKKVENMLGVNNDGLK